MPSLDLDTGLPGLYHASLAHVYPDDRGVSKALGLGRRAADRALGQVAAAAAAREPAANPAIPAPGSAP
jgi:hypothetical protein